MRIALLCVLLAGCAAPHQPERDGVWINTPRELVRCDQRGDEIVCRSVRSVRVEEAGL